VFNPGRETSRALAGSLTAGGNCVDADSVIKGTAVADTLNGKRRVDRSLVPVMVPAMILDELAHQLRRSYESALALKRQANDTSGRQRDRDPLVVAKEYATRVGSDARHACRALREHGELRGDDPRDLRAIVDRNLDALFELSTLIDELAAQVERVE
jgi:hypothetical protein